MHLSAFIISCRIFLQPVNDLLIRYLDLIRFFCRNNQLQYVEQLPGISAGITQHGICLFQDNIFILQYDVLFDRLI